MKTTGIVRKIDGLGRIVIPKEIRSTMFMKEGTALSIEVVEDGLFLKKHNMVDCLCDVACNYCDVLFESLQYPVLITSDERVICCAGASKKQYLNKEISSELKNIIHNSKNYTASDEFKTTLLPIVVKDEMKYMSEVIIPILCDGVCSGLIVLLSFDKEITPNSTDVKVLQTVSKIISKHIE